MSIERTSGGHATAAEELAALREEMAEVRASLKGLVRAAKHDGASALGQFGERVQGAAREAGARLASAYGTAREQSEAAVKVSREKIQERPLTSVLIALGAGLLIGKFLLGRKHG